MTASVLKKTASAFLFFLCFLLFAEDLPQDASSVAEVPEISYLNSNNKFRLLEYDGEVLDITFSKEGGIRTKVLAAGERVVINTFDELMRVIETAVFSQKNGKNVLTAKTNFIYEEQQHLPSEGTEIDYSKNEKTVYLYTKNGYLMLLKRYSGTYELSSSQIGEDTLLFEEKYTYDEDDRIIELLKKTDNTETRYVYVYDKEFANPDTMIFINDVLREEKHYKDDESYTKITYFDDNQSVAVVYENGIKKEEIFKDGLKILRRTSY